MSNPNYKPPTYKGWRRLRPMTLTKQGDMMTASINKPTADQYPNTTTGGGWCPAAIDMKFPPNMLVYRPTKTKPTVNPES